MNQLNIKLRSIARACGLTQLFRRLAPSRDYEERFHGALMGAIREGDHIWDIGANVGLYTQLFADAAGSGGKVFAFEPSPGAAAQIEEIAKKYSSVAVVNKAISDEAGEAFFDISSGADSVTNHLTKEVSGSSETVRVEVVTGDLMMETLGVPQIIKIDVEGFEYEVIRGMETLLKAPELRGVFCEVHFAVLESRGLANAPIEIEQRLKRAGFNVRWSDPSHIAATRN